MVKLFYSGKNVKYLDTEQLIQILKLFNSNSTALFLMYLKQMVFVTGGL